MSIPNVSDLWFTRCPVPTALGIAVQLGWFKEEFAPDGIELRSIQESSDPRVQGSHFDHTLARSFRQGGNIPALWARGNGRDTRLIGLSWTDEFQAILTLSDTGIRTGKDLAGRRIGLPVNPVPIDFNRASALRGFHNTLALAGLGLGDVEHVDTVQAGAEGVSGIASGEGFRTRRRHGYRAETLALVRGDVDAIYVKGALGLETARLIGARIVESLGDHPDARIRANNGTPRTLTVDAALLQAEPRLVERFLGRVIQAGDWAAAHPDETLDYIAREAGTSADWARLAYGADAHLRLQTFLTDEAITALGAFKDFLFEHGFIPQDFDIAEWVDPAPLAAIGRLERRAA